MNKYIRAAYCVPCGIIKMVWTKLFHPTGFNCGYLCALSPMSEISLDNGGRLSLGKKFKMRDGAKLRVRKGAVCTIGKNVSLNSGNIITCRESIEIGDDVMFSPNVLVYDHDHDFRSENGVKDGKYKTSPIKIGNNVWIGANSVILRGTTIGDNCVIGAGSIVKGVIPDNSLYYQKKDSETKIIEREV